MTEETKAVIIVLAAGGGLLVTITAQVIVLLKLVRGWIDKAMAKHYFYEHVMDQGKGETVKTRLIRCDDNCPVLHPGSGGGSSTGRYEHVRRRG
jgi:hypothetical protein